MENHKNPVVYAIKVEGNNVTSDKLILREMMLRPGIVATQELIKRDRLRLESLGLFNRVLVSLVEDEGRAVVLVTVTEPFYIYLFPRLRYALKTVSLRFLFSEYWRKGIKLGF